VNRIVNNQIVAVYKINNNLPIKEKANIYKAKGYIKPY
jgi:hypothetical protein